MPPVAPVPTQPPPVPTRPLAIPQSSPPPPVASLVPNLPGSSAQVSPSQPPFETPTPVVLTPKSARAEQGKVYEFNLYTHCGVDFEVDFDGSYWDLATLANLPSTVGNPAQHGTMKLVDTNHARFTFEGGSIDYVRHVGPKIVPGFCE
jgi:hypothetical protein